MKWIPLLIHLARSFGVSIRLLPGLLACGLLCGLLRCFFGGICPLLLPLMAGGLLIPVSNRNVVVFFAMYVVPVRVLAVFKNSGTELGNDIPYGRLRNSESKEAFSRRAPPCAKGSNDDG
ncbi:hypothetical protein B9Z55_028737 [Caenorhabditis nigoni]|uniref:Uncharacterized protein n=1 Tax=Caenorhabditis nigoni TaxID=1611254 RepID=A0A2G5SA95_9PELO|nr:hypothetical protein B9Z55_028737 [Caenorhabditis nigoni]